MSKGNMDAYFVEWGRRGQSLYGLAEDVMYAYAILEMLETALWNGSVNCITFIHWLTPGKYSRTFVQVQPHPFSFSRSVVLVVEGLATSAQLLLMSLLGTALFSVIYRVFFCSTIILTQRLSSTVLCISVDH